MGTPNYVSPEVLKCLETGPDDPCDPRKSDFWSLGVVGYEMVTGTTPFADENSMVNTYSNIMSAHYKNQNELKGLSKDLRGLINGLLADLEKRFGFEDLVRHQFFINIDWDELSNSCPPYVPDVKNEIDTTYFDVDRNSHEPQVPTNSIGKSGSDNVIIGFSYAGKHAESLRYSRQFGGDDCSDMVSSLRRQNEDLRHRLNRMEQEKASAEKKGGSKLNATFSEKEAAELQKLCHTESKELRNTISRLEKMLEIERAERSVTEKKSLELLTELKRKWQDREEARVESVKNALQQSETRQSSLEMELKEAKAIVEEQQKEYEAAMKVKSGLKNKLKECKAKLESTIVKYEEEVKKSRNLERNNSALVEVETNRRRSEGIDYKRKLSECHDKIDSLEQNASKLQKDIVSLKKVNEDQKETIKFLTEEKKCLESDHSEQMKKVKRDKLQAEHNTEQARGEVQRLETENESAQKKLRSKDDKLSHLEELLKTLEEKIRPIDRLSKAPTPKEDCKCKDEVRMQKVEIRVLERKVADLEGRVKFLREVMVKEERDGKDKAVKELEELKESTKVQTDELERAVREKERAEKSNSSLKNEVSSLQKKVSSLLTSADDASTLKFKLDQTEKLLKSSRQELEDCENVKKTLEAMKIACLEVEDQNTEYETVVERLTKSIESYKASYEKYKKEAHDLSNDKAGLKKENNELKSKLIYTETQLKEIKTKHDEIETLYRKEEQGWNEQYRKVSCAKQEQGQTLAQLKNQLTAMAKNYDLVSQESADLKEMNRGLKEETTKLTTNVLSVKESNLKLNRVMEEMLKKIEEKNSKIAKLEDNLHSTVEERERKELEANTTIIQLRKLVDHLQSKNDALKHGKGAKSKKRHADQTWALSYEEVMDALDKERHKTRNLTEELRRIRSPLKSPRK